MLLFFYENFVQDDSHAFSYLYKMAVSFLCNRVWLKATLEAKILSQKVTDTDLNFPEVISLHALSNHNILEVAYQSKWTVLCWVPLIYVTFWSQPAQPKYLLSCHRVTISASAVY